MRDNLSDLLYMLCAYFAVEDYSIAEIKELKSKTRMSIPEISIVLCKSPERTKAYFKDVSIKRKTRVEIGRKLREIIHK